MNFNLGLLTWVPSTELHSIEVVQFQKINLRCESVIKCTGIIGSEHVRSKTSRGVLTSIGRRPQEVFIFINHTVTGKLICMKTFVSI